MAYTIDQYLEDIEDWPDAELEVDRDADFEHDQWLRERETGYQLNNMFSVEDDDLDHRDELSTE